MTLYNLMKEYEVKEESFETFVDKHLKKDGVDQRFIECYTEEMKKELDELGYCTIMFYCSVSGKVVSFYK